MRSWVFVSVLWVFCFSSPFAMGAEASLKCDTGPITKTYGKTRWEVYSCADGRTLVIHSAPGNPATPFYFMFYPTETGYRLHSEGTGRKEATAAAYDELRNLSVLEIDALIKETKSGAAW